MTTIQSTGRLSHKPRIRTGTGIGALIAVGVAISVLALPNTGTTHPVVHSQPPTYPLIQYRGTGAPLVAAATHTAPVYIRAEHSYGAVP